MKTTVLIHHSGSPTFARVPHTLLEDETLSWNAKGILCYLLGKPPGWKMRVQDIKNKGKDGAKAIRTGLSDLRAAGYAKLTAIRKSGRILEWEWQVADHQMFHVGEESAIAAGEIQPSEEEAKGAPIRTPKSAYSDLLRDPRWQRKRLEIMKRDDFSCVKCGTGKEELNIHHLRYDKGKNPWEYDDADLVTWCRTCHELHHKVRSATGATR